MKAEVRGLEDKLKEVAEEDSAKLARIEKLQSALEEKNTVLQSINEKLNPEVEKISPKVRSKGFGTSKGSTPRSQPGKKRKRDKGETSPETLAARKTSKKCVVIIAPASSSTISLYV
jgi:hypothetical protein